MKKVTLSLDLGANRPPSIKLTLGIETGPNNSLRTLLERKSGELSDETVAVKMNGFDTRKGVFSMYDSRNNITHHGQITRSLMTNYRTFFLKFGEILRYQTQRYSIFIYVKNAENGYSLEHQIVESNLCKTAFERIKASLRDDSGFDPKIKTVAFKDGDWSPTYGEIA